MKFSVLGQAVVVDADEVVVGVVVGCLQMWVVGRAAGQAGMSTATAMVAAARVVPT